MFRYSGISSKCGQVYYNGITQQEINHNNINKNKDKNVLRFSLKGELLEIEREREVMTGERDKERQKAQGKKHLSDIQKNLISIQII